MLFSPELQGQLARERLERELAQARLQRQVRPAASSMRQAVGRRFIAIGDWLAAEPSLESIRSR